jgi:hypothetical protein
MPRFHSSPGESNWVHRGTIGRVQSRIGHHSLQDSAPFLPTLIKFKCGAVASARVKDSRDSNVRKEWDGTGMIE